MERPPLARRALFPALVLLVAAAGTATALTLRSGSGSGPSGLTATFTRTAGWQGGYVGDFLIQNGGPTVSDWVLSFDLPAGEKVTNEWNGTLSGGDPYVVTNLAWDGHLAPGASAEVGLQVVDPGSYAPPTGCTLDGTSCAGGVQTTTTPVTSTTTPAVAPQGTGRAGGAFRFAPYVDTTVDSPPFDLTSDMRSSGTRYFTLAFVVAEGGACQASWGGYYPVSTGYYLPEIEALRAAGGDVAISFGGEAGTELAEACTSVTSLVAQYRSVIVKYRVTRLDFDVEGADLGDAAAMARRFEAIAELERSDPRLSVSLTLPVLPSGLDASGLAVLHAAISAGARIDLVNVMAMDYGDSLAPQPAGKMGTYAVEATEATHAQLAELYPGVGSAQLWRTVGVTVLLGVNDVPDEVFGLADAARLLSFAERVGLGEITMWAATRDGACAGEASLTDSDTCSGIAQQPFAFSDLFSRYG
jgi:hypothetical protein